VNIVNYQKPQLVTVSQAVDVVQGGKNNSATTDINLRHTTANAYEADE
jgi:hypothetical protein